MSTASAASASATPSTLTTVADAAELADAVGCFRDFCVTFNDFLNSIVETENTLCKVILPVDYRNCPLDLNFTSHESLGEALRRSLAVRQVDVPGVDPRELVSPTAIFRSAVNDARQLIRLCKYNQLPDQPVPDVPEEETVTDMGQRVRDAWMQVRLCGDRGALQEI